MCSMNRVAEPNAILIPVGIRRRPLVIRRVIQPTVIRFRIDCIEKIDLHVLKRERFFFCVDRSVEHLRRRRSSLPGEELRRYISELVRQYSFVGREDARRLKFDAVVSRKRRATKFTHSRRPRHVVSRAVTTVS